MKKLVYLLTCLSLPLAFLFVLLSLLGQASAAPPTAVSLPIQLDRGVMETPSLAALDARAKDVPLALATEAALLTPKSSTALTPASASQQGDVAGEVLSATVSPDLVEAGTTLTFAVKIRNHGSISWGPNSVHANIHIYDSEGKLQTTIIASYVSPPMPVASNGEAILFGYFSVPTSWSGTYNYTVELFAQERSLVDASGFTFAVSSISAETAETLDELPGLYVLTSAASGGSLDLVIAIDSTGSMCGTINTAKANAQDIADRIRSSIPDSRFALIDFRDFADGSPWPTIVRQDLTSDVLAFKSAVNEMVCGGGGDWPEAYIDVVYTAADNISWRGNVARILLIMGDAPPHDANYGTGTGDVDPYGRTWAGAANEALSRGVKVAMIAVGGGVGNSTVEQSYQDMANITGGLYRAAPDNATLAQDIVALVREMAPNPLAESPPTMGQSQSVRNMLSLLREAEHDDEVFYGINLPQDASEFERALITNYQFGGVITINIPISRYYGLVDENGHLTDGLVIDDYGEVVYKRNPIGKSVAEKARLTIMAYDVDYLYRNPFEFVPDPLPPREEDIIYVNGTSIPSYYFGEPHPEILEGRNREWVSHSYLVPTEFLKFPPLTGNRPGIVTNTITIEVDSENFGYATEVAWARLEIPGTYPILLVPGYGGGSGDGYWKELEQYLLAEGYIVNTTCFFGEEKLETDVEKSSVAGQAELLDDFVSNTLLPRYNTDKINIVSHSAGGLDSRAYIRNTSGQNVATLVTISGPHRGTYLADTLRSVILPADLSWQALLGPLLGGPPFTHYCRLCERTKNISEKYVNTEFNWRHPAKSDVNYYAVIADASRPDDFSKYSDERQSETGSWANMVFPLTYQVLYEHSDYGNNYTGLFNGRNDGFVPMRSQSLQEVPGHVLGENTEIYLVRDNHDTSRKSDRIGALLTDILHVDNQRRLVPQSELSVSEVQGLNALEEVTPTLPSTLIFSGVISESTTITKTLYVDSNQMADVGLFWDRQPVTFTLHYPNGTIVRADDPGVTYTEIISDVGAYALTYSIENPSTGSWQAVLQAGAPLTDGVSSWLLMFTQRSSISSTLRTDADSYHIGDTAIVSAEVFSETVAITGADARLTIVDPIDTVTETLLFDDGTHGDPAAGDGEYTNQFIVNQPGTYYVTADITGTTPSGTVFQKSATTGITVLSGDAVLSGVYSDTGVDSDGDGLFDYLSINVGLDVTREDSFEISGNLYGSGGTLISNATNVITLTSGSHDIPLNFDGTTIADANISGRFLLDEVIVTDFDADTITEMATKVYTTSVYSASQFQHDPIRLTGTITDTGVDTDANDLYELLRVNTPLDVQHAGAYTVTVSLTDGNGRGITGFTWPYTLTAGLNTLALDFNGPSINLYNADGPYQVKNFLISRTSTETLEVTDLHTTQPYSYTTFEADTVAPSSAINPLPAVITTTPVINVTWSGSDPEPSSGIAFYDVQYKVGSTGSWTDWLTQTVLT